MLTRINFEDIDRTIAAANAGRTEPEAIAELCRSFAALPAGTDDIARLDPFSPAYRAAILKVLALITLRPDYQPLRDEAVNYLPASGENYLPSIYHSGESAWLGELLQAYGGVLKVLDLRRGARVLEYGAGEGYIAVQLARLGCDVTVVDIEPRCLNIVKAEAAALRTSVTALHGQFGDGPDGATFDVILFFEAFHHALDHLRLLPRLRDRLAPNGRIVFAGEPIMEADGYWAPTLPYAWGPRLDALSLRAMRTYGWCELGFSRDYFVEALMRAGFVVRFQPCAATERGAAYIAQFHDGTIDLGAAILLGSHGHNGGWHGPEGTHRWTAEEEAVLPLDQTSGWAAVSIRLSNWLPGARQVSLTAGRESKTMTIPSGETTEVTLPLRDAPPRLLLRCATTRLDASVDTRAFGVAAQCITYRSATTS